MRIIYADDAPTIMEQVCDCLRSNGHEAVGVETDNLLDFQDQISFMLKKGFAPDVLVLGGHNLLRDRSGQPLLDISGFDLCNWLSAAQPVKECRVILFSRDEDLRKFAHQYPELGFKAVVAKDDPNYLSNLVRAIETNE